VKGLRARGGVEIDIAWKDGKASSVVLRPAVDGTWQVRAPRGQKIAGIRSAKGAAQLRPGGDGAVEVTLSRSAVWRIQFA
jgi:hypothetical protein